MKNFLFFILLFSFIARDPFLISSLEELEKRARIELELLNFPCHGDWIPQRKTSGGEHIYDVVIVGAGQTGIAAAFSLQQEKIFNIILFDSNKKGEEGEWHVHARMDNLRSSKGTIGPDCGIPSLTVRAWFEAKYGKEEWDRICYLPRLDWIAYLDWLRHFFNLPIVNEATVKAIDWNESEGCFYIPVVISGVETYVYAKKIVFATGLQGSGEWSVPDYVKNNIPKERYFQTHENIDFSLFKGKKIAILGGGSCAFDNALLAANTANEVHMFIKRPKLVNISLQRWAQFVGFLHGFPSLSDEYKWKYMARFYEIGQTPTTSAVEHAKTRTNIIMHFESPWTNTQLNEDGSISVITPKGKFECDYLIIAIGWITDIQKREEFSLLKDKIALWSDKFNTPYDGNYSNLLRAPYLGRGFNFTEKIEGTAPYLHSIFNMTGGATLSTGISAGTGIAGMKYSLKWMIQEIVNQFFLENQDVFYQEFVEYNEVIFENY